MTQQTYTPDWSKAPPQANWWARDKDGSGFWYSKRPIAHRHSFVADGDFVRADNDCPFIDCSFELDDWQSTLTERPSQPQNILQNLSDYFTGKTSFISAYVDLLLARMAKKERYGDGNWVTEKCLSVHDVVYFVNHNDRCFSVVEKITASGLIILSYGVCIDGGPHWASLRTFNIDTAKIRTITELEAAQFRAAMEAVYG